MLKLSHLFSIWQLWQVHEFFRLRLSSSAMLLILFFLKRSATPPLARVGLSMNMWKLGNSLSIIPIVHFLISVRHIMSNLIFRLFRYAARSAPFLLKLSIFR